MKGGGRLATTATAPKARTPAGVGGHPAPAARVWTARGVVPDLGPMFEPRELRVRGQLLAAARAGDPRAIRTLWRVYRVRLLPADG